jgi:hypothetical protein
LAGATAEVETFLVASDVASEIESGAREQIAIAIAEFDRRRD